METGLSGINEVAAAYNVSLRTLRFYEQIGLLTPVRVGTTRLYSIRDRIRLEVILKGRRLGFSLSEIKKLLPLTHHSHATAKVEFVQLLKPAEIDQQLVVLGERRAKIAEALDELREKCRGRWSTATALHDSGLLLHEAT